MSSLKTSWRSRPPARLEAQARAVNGAQVLAARLDGMDRQQMRALADSLRNKWKSAVVVLASVEDGSVSIVSAVTKDLTGKVHAGKLAAARRPGRRRQRRRPARHGRRRRQGCRRARRRAGSRSTAKWRASCERRLRTPP